MVLLIPLAIFLVLSVLMIVLLSGTKPPTAIDNVEALCDAILRGDTKTQDSLTSMEKVSSTVVHAIGELKSEHEETATSFNCKIEKQWDDLNASYCLVSVPLSSLGESVHFTCRFIVNQWTVVSVQIVSPKSKAPQK